MYLRSITLLLFLLTTSLATAELTMPAVFGDNMVLQRNADVAIYGTAAPKERITVQVTWDKQSFRTRADENGRWRVDIPTGAASVGEAVKVSGSNSLEFKNVCLGEVWICSGQSNMARLLLGRGNGPIDNGFSVIKEANRPDIRLYTLPPVSESVPQADNPSEWLVSDHETAAAFSAVGYIFGKELNDYLGVPIGLILNAWGGSCVEAWVSKTKLHLMGITAENNYYLARSADQSVRTNKQHEPAALFNGMIHPLIPYTIKGVIWYQGEANTVDADAYAELLSGMIADWRASWGISDLPFYQVQLAPYSYPAGRDNSALLREAQVEVSKTVPHVSTAVILDLGLEKDIHPPYKIPVGERLALLALANTYGVKGFPQGCPTYSSMQVERSQVRVRFEHDGGGLFVKGENVNGLELAGEDRVFYPATGKATSQGELLVSSEDVAVPVAVRYGFTDWVQGNLFSINGFPVSSFRTDDWDQ